MTHGDRTVAGPLAEFTFQTAAVKIGATEYGLRSCPFCGGNRLSVVETGSENNTVMHYVICGSCVARGPFHGQIKGAIEKWNERV